MVMVTMTGENRSAPQRNCSAASMLRCLRKTRRQILERPRSWWQRIGPQLCLRMCWRVPHFHRYPNHGLETSHSMSESPQKKNISPEFGRTEKDQSLSPSHRPQGRGQHTWPLGLNQRHTLFESPPARLVSPLVPERGGSQPEHGPPKPQISSKAKKNHKLTRKLFAKRARWTCGYGLASWNSACKRLSTAEAGF